MPFADQFLFEVQGSSDAFRVARLEGVEAISEPFRFALVLTSEDPAISLSSIVGKPALLTIVHEETPRHVHGMVVRFERGDQGKKVTTYHATLVPKVVRLDHRDDCRIFQELTAPEIIKKVLEGAGLAAGDDFRLALQGEYVKREYCVQYRESDFAFISRLMEEEGIFYFFEHSEDKHVMVLGDRKAAHSPIAGEATVVFREPGGALRLAEHVQRFRWSEEVRTGKYTLRDWTFLKPSLLLEGTAQGSLDTDLEIYDHPGDYDAPATGTALAKLRLEERSALRKRGEGESGVARLTAGALFTMSEHPSEALNREYLLTRIEHHGTEPNMGEAEAGAEARYENRFDVIPSDVPFRPPLATPRPTIKGVQSAIVTGPSGEEIYTDEHGRVKVQFHWDRLGKKDDKSSCWIRVSQVWAGEGWGAMHIPRINQEVLVDFLDGDPDRPIIVGRVYHGTNVPPYGLPANKTRSTIKSNTTPGGGGSNELRFEDKKDSEEVYLHAQKDLTIAVENDKNQTVGHDETLKVSNDRTKEVGNDQSMKVGNDQKTEVGNDETESIGNDRSVDVGRDHTESIGRNMVISVGKDLTLDVSGDAKETIGGDCKLVVSKGYDIEVSASMSTKVGGSQTTKVDGDQTITVAGKIVIECGSSKVTIEKSGKISVEGVNIEVKASAAAKITAADASIAASGKVDIKSDGTTSIKASGPVALKGALVGIN